MKANTIKSVHPKKNRTVAESLQSLARTHYENFPVGSFLISKEFRKPIHSVYTFARIADDIADEGSDSPEIRLQRLDEWEGQLKVALAGEKGERFFQELAETIAKFAIPAALFSDLITAFRMDARGTEYATFDDVKFYCHHSANPIGRILLYIFNCANDETCRLSDAICTALQLTNFWQDLSIDIKRNRVYIPREDFERFGVTREDLSRRSKTRLVEDGFPRSEAGTEKVRPLLKFQVERTKQFFLEGKPLVRSINKKFAFELKLTYNGGMRVLEKIELLKYDTLHRRPTLSKADWALIVARSLLTR